MFPRPLVSRHIWLAALLAALAGAVYAGGPRVAMVVEARGMPAAARLTPGRFLDSGVRLRLPAGARVRLILTAGLASGRVERLEGPCLAVVEAGGARLLEGPRQRKVVERRVPPDLAPDGRDTSQFAGHVSRGPGALRPLPVAAEKPVFRWLGPPSARYEVTVFQEWDGVPVWRVVCRETEVAYDGPPLKHDRVYRWEVGAPERETARAWFLRLSTRGREELESARREAERWAAAAPGDPAPFLLLAEECAARLQFGRAADAMARATAARPEDPAIRERWAAMLDSAGRYEEADRARGKG